MWDGASFRLEPGLGASPGAPDLVLMVDDWFAFVELKTGTKLRAGQKRFARWCARAGVAWVCIQRKANGSLVFVGPNGKQASIRRDIDELEAKDFRFTIDAVQ
jgi:hypothetical protein